MEISAMLSQLRDPMGVPFFPVVFQVLMVLTFALHIFMVNIVVGGSFMAIWSRVKGGDYNLRLSKTLAKATTVNLSVAILLGIAPLLFVQVIYDPFWYSATLMSGWWSMLFLLIIMLGFLALYVFYLKGRNGTSGGGMFGWFTLGAVLFAGVIMHMLAMQSLHPEEWVKWYAPGGVMDTSGWAFNAFSIERFLHFIVPAFINTGIFMMLYAWYFKPRSDMDGAYLDWVAGVGAKMALYAFFVQIAIGFWFLLGLPAELNFIYNPWVWIAALLALVALGMVVKAQKDPIASAPILGLLSVVAVLGMSINREVLRMKYVGVYEYSIYDYPMSMDWGSTALFLATFVAGLVVIAYPIGIAFKAGRMSAEAAKEL
ncbi:MAG: hypothetical protein C0608_05045 [Deltaproteobacteria bacterium]|nr:MAG: hypothetical protein C0608_05045 [Deltaproteobacteria bacterium]